MLLLLFSRKRSEPIPDLSGIGGGWVWGRKSSEPGRLPQPEFSREPWDEQEEIGLIVAVHATHY